MILIFVSSRIGTARSWLGSRSDRYVLSSLVLVLLILSALTSVLAGTYSLVTGDVRGGRWTGLVALLYGSLYVLIIVPMVRRRARMWHVLAGIVLLWPEHSVESWLTDPDPQRQLLGAPLVLLIWFGAHWVSAIRRARHVAATSANAPPISH